MSYTHQHCYHKEMFKQTPTQSMNVVHIGKNNHYFHLLETSDIREDKLQ